MTPAVRAAGSGVQSGVVTVPPALSQRVHREVRAPLSTRDQATFALQGLSPPAGHRQTLQQPPHRTPAGNTTRTALFPRRRDKRYLECALSLHGEQVSVEGYQVQAVLLSVDEGPQHALLLQPLLAEQAAARHEEDVEVPLGRAASVFPGRGRGRSTPKGNSAAWAAGAGHGHRVQAVITASFRSCLRFRMRLDPATGLKPGQGDLVSLQVSKGGSSEARCIPAN